MSLRPEDIRSILATDCGSTTTKAILIEKGADGFRLSARGEAPTTVEAPFEDVTRGVLNAVREVEELRGRKLLQGDRILSQEFRTMYPDIWDLVDSPAATRVNAYLYGCGTAELLNTELDSLGLSDAGKARLQTGLPVGACSVK